MSRGLDAELAMALGDMKWVNNAGGTCRYIVPVEMEHGGLPADMALPLCGTWNPKTPAYSTDLNACHTAELRMIELGLGGLYLQALSAQFPPQDTGNSAGRLMAAMTALSLWHTTAPAEARCRAMLSVLEGEK